MLAIREEELNMVSGGMAIGGLFGAPKFKSGDSVVCKSRPDLGIGTVLKCDYNRRWWYTVAVDCGELYTFEDNLEYLIM